MIFIALGIVLLAAAAVMLWLAFTAPDGWQDAGGWHAGPAPTGAATASAINHRGRLAAAASETNEHDQPDSPRGA